eukprot:gnl/Spiro4/25412_TR12674_c0_g2_i1.p1 gnl/Spiro4/25412_TR12674_c0_g2~~gnl/Spiro4/25412_TR12674_c0_g2_i1.p1  ORF type:complete len:110 (+),score=24.00 gnl/Spiro4/25412_TR12674_c0_g2_i1:130-459(+)
MADVSELAVTYAALILADDNVAITADKLSKLVEAAGVTVQPFWPALFARVLAGKKVDDILLSGGGGAAPAAAPVATSAAPAKEAPKEEKKKKEEPKEEEDEDMGLGLFD